MEKTKKRILIWVAYDGTDYHGFQYQEGLPTIQGILEDALSKQLKEEIHVTGGSRTDAGVHAMCNVCVFDTESSIPAEKYPLAVNPLLPGAIRIVKGEEVAADFHPRKCDTRKTYEYCFSYGDVCNPKRRLYASHVPMKPDIDKMQAAAKSMEGEHDFSSFCSAGAQVNSFVRTVYSVDVKECDGEIRIYVTGNGFLYNMVRIMAGTLLEAGRGRFTPEDVTKIIEAKDRSKAGPTAPPEGLTLLKYEFL